MDYTWLVRFNYGLSLALHNFFASVPLGIAVIHFYYALLNYREPSKENTLLSKFAFHILVLSIILSASSGFALELEFPRYWPEFYSSIKNLNRHIGHKSAVISFFGGSLLILATYYFKLFRHRLIYVFLSFFWIFLSWLFGGWGIFVNTLMQHPGTAFMQDKVLILKEPVMDHFLSGYHVLRQLHIAAASVLKSVVILCLLISLIDKKLLLQEFRRLSSIALICLFGLGITGHFQAINVSHYQPSKFSAMEGILTSKDTTSWHLIGFMALDARKFTIPFNHILSILTDAKLIPISEIPPSETPPVVTVFNSFRLMLYSFFSTLVIILLLRFSKNKVSLGLLMLLFILIEIAITSGWILTETGRQPWFFWGLQRRELTTTMPSHLFLSLIVGFANAVLLTVASYSGILLLRKTYTHEASMKEHEE